MEPLLLLRCFGAQALLVGAQLGRQGRAEVVDRDGGTRNVEDEVILLKKYIADVQALQRLRNLNTFC